jgi:glycosyltransferase involved in cell wall biosynthesis
MSAIATLRGVLRHAKTTVDVVRARSGRADISFFFDFVPPPYGGGNQFLRALWSELERRGYRLEANRVSPTARACLCNAFNFDVARLRRFRRAGCRIVHRVDGPVSAYRGADDGTDGRVAAINAEFADATIVQSRYSLAEQAVRGFTFRSPRVIYNAADPAIFNAIGREAPPRGRKVRLISASWSDNPNKGRAAYKHLETVLDWTRFDYTFVGRTSAAFERVRVVPPQGSHDLAALFRAHDVFVTASVNDPCSNALVEAMSCGLPALYVNSGGHPELVGGAGLAFSDAAEIPGLLDRLVREYESFQARLEPPRLSAVAEQYLETLGIAAP